MPSTTSKGRLLSNYITNWLSRLAAKYGAEWDRKPGWQSDTSSITSNLTPQVWACRVYVHCTAGLGRAPAVIIAYLFWFKDMGLDEVRSHLISIKASVSSQGCLAPVLLPCTTPWLNIGDHIRVGIQAFDRHQAMWTKARCYTGCHL